jgi:hypothetical protein
VIPTSEEQSEKLLCFYDTYIYLLLYIKFFSFLWRQPRTLLSIILRMLITFTNDNDVIVYAPETMISYASNNQNIFLTQSVWWISSIIRLQEGLITHIENLNI